MLRTVVGLCLSKSRRQKPPQSEGALRQRRHSQCSVAPTPAIARMFSDALRVVGKRTDKTKKQNMTLLAEILFECAIEDNQSWAFQQIADRLEGKPVQVVDAMVDDNRTVHQFSDAELSAILRRRVGVLPVESDEERPEGGALN